MQRKLDAWRNYYQDVNMEDYPFKKYLEETGYSGELYVCFGEFIETEYRNKEFMAYLLDNAELYQEYLKDCENDDVE